MLTLSQNFRTHTLQYIYIYMYISVMKFAYVKYTFRHICIHTIHAYTTYMHTCKTYIQDNTDIHTVIHTFNTILYTRTIRYNTIQYNTIQYNTIQYNTHTLQYTHTLRYTHTMQYKIYITYNTHTYIHPSIHTYIHTYIQDRSRQERDKATHRGLMELTFPEIQRCLKR